MGEIAAEIDLRDVVDAPAFRCLHDAPGDIRGAVVDHHRRAGVRRHAGLLVAAHRRDERPRPGELRELHGVESDRAGAAGDEHILAFERPVVEERVVGRHRRHAERGAALEGRARRQRHRLARGQSHVFGCRAEGPPALRVPDPDLLPEAAPAHALADRVDLAGAVAVRDDQRMAWPVADTEAAIAVGRVDTGEANPHPHLARPGPRLGELADLQHLAGGAVSGVEGRLHAGTSLAARAGRASASISRQRRQATSCATPAGVSSGTTSAHGAAA